MLLARHRIIAVCRSLSNIAGIAKGMSVTFGEMFQPTDGGELSRRPRAHARREIPGALSRTRTTCSAMKMAGKVCRMLSVRRRLSRQLHLYEAAENTAEQRISSAERYAKVYNIDYNRCIFCGYCVEACPTDAITHGHGFELATINATNLVMRKEDMLVQIRRCAGTA